MRINKFVASATGLSRRAADRAIADSRVTINQKPATPGDSATDADVVTLDNRVLTAAVPLQTIMLHKPRGYVSSRAGQGSRTIYDLLPPDLHHLKPVGRLDKYSSGLLLLTNDGDLANQLTHPRYAKTKIYQITLDKALTEADHKIITGHGVSLEDGLSKLQLDPLPLASHATKASPESPAQPNPGSSSGRAWRVTMTEGRNRQIRRTFAALDYQVTKLHRTHFGAYQLGDLPKGQSSKQ